jgi:hypothetical protein
MSTHQAILCGDRLMPIQRVDPAGWAQSQNAPQKRQTIAVGLASLVKFYVVSF